MKTDTLSDELKRHFGEMAAMLYERCKDGTRTMEYFHRLDGADIKIEVTPRDDRVYFSQVDSPETFPED